MFKRKRTTRRKEKGKGRKRKKKKKAGLWGPARLYFPWRSGAAPKGRHPLWQQNKGASIPEGTARLRENYSGPSVLRPPLFPFQIAAKEEEGSLAWETREAAGVRVRGGGDPHHCASARWGERGGGVVVAGVAGTLFHNQRTTNPTCSPVSETREPRQRSGGARTIGQGRAGRSPSHLHSYPARSSPSSERCSSGSSC